MADAHPVPNFLLATAAERHAGYARLRGESPVHTVRLNSGETAWLVTGFEEVRQSLVDTRMEPRTATVGAKRRLSEDVLLSMNSHMLNCNPPDHTRLRRLVAAAFTRRRMDQMRGRIQEITDKLLDAVDGPGEVDLLERFALPLPLVVLSDLIGVPEEDTDLFHGWTAPLTASDVTFDELEDAAGKMTQYIRSLIEMKRREPGSDLLSALVAVRDGEDRLTEYELSSMIFLLLAAGHETTVNLVGNGILSLLTNPGQLARLRARPELLRSTVEEVLRMESPVQICLRTCTEPVELAGVTIPTGGTVILSLLAANRDPERFEAPDSFRVDRTPNPQLAFGYGFHHCIGAPLARLEGTIAIGTLFTRFPDIALAVPAGELKDRVSFVMHGLDALPVRLH